MEPHNSIWSRAKHLFKTDGRAGRVAFWIITLPIYVLLVAQYGLVAGWLLSISFYLGGVLGAHFGGLAEWFDDVLNLIIPAAIVMLMIATQVRRLHDLGRGGHWWWLFTFVPLVVAPLACAVALHFFADEGASEIAFMLFNDGIGVNEIIVLATFAVVGLPFMLWGIVEMGFLRGSRGDNRYGPDLAAG